MSATDEEEQTREGDARREKRRRRASNAKVYKTLEARVSERKEFSFFTRYRYQYLYHHFIHPSTRHRHRASPP